jgi:hypothetical protein
MTKLDLTNEEVISKIEGIIHEDVGNRGTETVFAITKGNLKGLAKSIAAQTKPHVIISTGFFIPKGEVPAAETDGPPGSVLLAAGLKKMGIPCRLVTDQHCEAAIKAALRQIGADIPLDVVANDAQVRLYKSKCERMGITHAIAIERAGPGDDGKIRNMRADDITDYTVSLEPLFRDVPWVTAGVLDGGNEISAGNKEIRPLVRQHVKHGEIISCRTAVGYPIAAGISNWGAYAILGALGAENPEWKRPALETLHIGLHQDIMRGMSQDGPAVDGVTRQRAFSVDGLPFLKQQEILTRIASVLKPDLRNQIAETTPLIGQSGFFEPLTLAESLIVSGSDRMPPSDQLEAHKRHFYLPYLEQVAEANRLVLFDRELSAKGLELPSSVLSEDITAHIPIWLSLFPREDGKLTGHTDLQYFVSEYADACNARNRHVDQLDWLIRRLNSFYDGESADPHDRSAAEYYHGLSAEDFKEAGARSNAVSPGYRPYGFTPERRSKIKRDVSFPMNAVV